MIPFLLSRDLQDMVEVNAKFSTNVKRKGLRGTLGLTNSDGGGAGYIVGRVGSCISGVSSVGCRASNSFGARANSGKSISSSVSSGSNVESSGGIGSFRNANGSGYCLKLILGSIVTRVLEQWQHTTSATRRKCNSRQKREDCDFVLRYCWLAHQAPAWETDEVNSNTSRLSVKLLFPKQIHFITHQRKTADGRTRCSRSAVEAF